MNGDLSGCAKLRTENCLPVQISQMEKCPNGDLSGPRLAHVEIMQGKVITCIWHFYRKFKF